MLGIALAAGSILEAASALLAIRRERASGGIHLFDFGADAIEGWKVTGGTLALHLAGGRMPEEVAISAIGAPWQQGDLDAATITFGGAGSAHGVFKTRSQEQWMEIALDGRVLQALADGKGYGLAIREHGFQVSGRRPLERQPRLLVEGLPGK